MQGGWLERYLTNVSNVELLVSTHVMGGENFIARFGLQSSFQKKKKIVFFSLVAMRSLVTGQRKKEMDKKLDYEEKNKLKEM